MFKNNPPKLVSFIVSFTVLPIAIYSVQRFSTHPVGNTAIWWLIQLVVVLILLISGILFFESENKKHFLFINLFLIWVVFSLIRGVFMAENYWDYKSLIERSFELLLPVIAYTASNKERLQSILSFYVKFILPFSILFLIPIPRGGWGWSWFLISFIILFLPVLKVQWRILLVVLSLVAAFADFSVRSHIIKYAIPIVLLLLYYFRFFIASYEIINVSRKIFIIAPWVLFFLAVSGIFNIFRIGDHVKVDYEAEARDQHGVLVETQSVTKDSRTFIYTEVLKSAKKYDYWILGRSPSRGNETVAFAGFIEKITGKPERYSNEANVPNIFTWMGIIGLFLYFLVFYNASYLAIKKSNNIYIKLVGLFVAFRWLYAWVEDYSSFGMNDFTIWVMIGICSSQSFRKMNDLEVKLWARGIFDDRYVKLMMFIKKGNFQNYPVIHKIDHL